jgi:hypothetical protein
MFPHPRDTFFFVSKETIVAKRKQSNHLKQSSHLAMFYVCLEDVAVTGSLLLYISVSLEFYK